MPTARIFSKSVIVCAAIVSLLILAGILELSRDRRFSESVFDQIKEGMSAQEAEGVLGVPAGDYRPEKWKNPDHYVSTSDPIGFVVKEAGMPIADVQEIERKEILAYKDHDSLMQPKIIWRDWLGARWGISIAIDENGQVIHHHLSEMVPPRPPGTLLGKFRWWIGI